MIIRLSPSLGIKYWLGEWCRLMLDWMITERIVRGMERLDEILVIEVEFRLE